MTLGPRSGQLIVLHAKGGSSREVPLNGTARRALIAYMATVRHCQATLPAVLEHWPCGALEWLLIWESQRGDAPSYRPVHKVVSDVLRAAVRRRARDACSDAARVATQLCPF